MTRPTVASRKRVNPENLARLGAERLAELLTEAAATKPELKRRLRMELAAEEGGEHLALEIDKRLATLDASRSKVSWRQRPTFVRDLDGVRVLIAGRLAGLDRTAALERLWRFMAVSRRVSPRVRDRDGELAAVFDRAAGDIGALIAGQDAEPGASALVEAIARDPGGAALWLPKVLEPAPADLAAATLRRLSQREDPAPGWIPIIRLLADAAGDVDAFASTFTSAGLRSPQVAADIGRRLLAAGRVADAGRVLKAGGPPPPSKKLLGGPRAVPPDYDWESAWIDYLERSGDLDAAQAARWASFERTLSAERARAFTSRLTGFEDVEAEGRAFDLAARHPDFERGLQFLMEWPALPEAARMIQARADEIQAPAEAAELWASRLRARQPAAAHLLLRKAAAAAFRRRELATCDRLTLEADAIEV